MEHLILGWRQSQVVEPRALNWTAGGCGFAALLDSMMVGSGSALPLRLAEQLAMVQEYRSEGIRPPQIAATIMCRSQKAMPPGENYAAIMSRGAVICSSDRRPDVSRARGTHPSSKTSSWCALNVLLACWLLFCGLELRSATVRWTTSPWDAALQPNHL